MEEWRDIPGYDGIYQASSLGRIRTCDGKTTYTERHGIRHWKQRTLKQKICKNKYGRCDARVSLWKDGKEKTVLVARAVASAFYGESDMTVNHKDGNSMNNSVENLEWISREDNIRHGFTTGLYDGIQKRVSIKNLSTGAVYSFNSLSKASSYIGRNKSYICIALKNGRNICDNSGNRYVVVS